MAVVKGTNAGFVTVAPSADPSGTVTTFKGYMKATKLVAPAGALKITEVGFWSDNCNTTTDWAMGLYSHDAGNDKPDARLYLVDTEQLTDADDGVWKSVAVDWDITAGTTYWLAGEVDSAGGTVNHNYSAAGGERYSVSGEGGATALPATWDAGSIEAENNIFDLYAVYTTELPINISGTIAATSTVSGALTIYGGVPLTGTIAATSSLSGALTIKSNWQTDSFKSIKRLIVIGNDSLYYEDI